MPSGPIPSLGPRKPEDDGPVAGPDALLKLVALLLGQVAARNRTVDARDGRIFDRALQLPRRFATSPRKPEPGSLEPVVANVAPPPSTAASPAAATSQRLRFISRSVSSEPDVRYEFPKSQPAMPSASPRFSSSAARFSRRCSIERVPGIGTTTGERCSSQASLTVVSGTPSRAAAAATPGPRTVQREVRDERDPFALAVVDDVVVLALGEVVVVLHRGDRHAPAGRARSAARSPRRSRRGGSLRGRRRR